MLTHIHPSRAWFTCRTSSFIKGPGSSSSESGPVPERPSAQSPFARLGRYLRQRDVKDLVRGRYPSFIAHTDSCVRPKSSFRLRFPYFDRSLQVAVSPCWKLALPDVISTICVKALGPLPRHVPVGLFVCTPVLSGSDDHPQDFGLATWGHGLGTASPHEGQVRHAKYPPHYNFSQGSVFRGCSHSLMFRLLYSLDPPVAPTAVSDTGQPGRLRHAMDMWLPALNSQGFT